jgi:tRNA pseudouridine38-40 synthase
MRVAYDGSGFAGFAPNPGVVTVGGTLAATLERVLRHPVTLTCAGRTDAGVHGWGQVVSFDTTLEPESLDLAALRRSVNGLCGPAVVVRDVELAEPDFDARFSAMSRTYRYRVLNRAVPDPFVAATTWHVSTPLDLAGMRLACDPFIGEHDFSSFCRKVADKTVLPKTLVRTVLAAAWDHLGDDLLQFEITANAFCQQMVRAIVGTLVEVGQGRKHAGHIAAILRARDRAFAGGLAPPHGLLLWRVDYPEPVPGWDLPAGPDFVEVSFGSP